MKIAELEADNQRYEERVYALERLLAERNGNVNVNGNGNDKSQKMHEIIEKLAG